MTIDIEQAQLVRARQLAAKSFGSAAWMNGNLDKHPAIAAIRTALAEANWQPPVDPDIAASRTALSNQFFFDFTSAVTQYEKACEIALAAYKAGKAARTPATSHE